MTVQNSHVPHSVCIVRKLPEYLIAIFVGEAFAVCLQDSAPSSPNATLKRVDGCPSVVDFRTAQYLKGINGLDAWQVALKPSSGGLRPSYFHLINKFRDFGLAQ